MSVAIAVFASGRGSNFDAIHRAIRTGALDARIVAVVSDRPEAPVLEKARAEGLKSVAVPVEKGETRESHEKRILETLAGDPPEFVVLAGYMRILSEFLIGAFDSGKGYSRIVNVHPSLLPAFPGVNSYRRAFEHGCAVAGATVHLVTPGVDEGPICSQRAFSIHDCADASEVEGRGLTVEHELYPEALGWILKEDFEIVSRVSTAGSGGSGKGRSCVRKA